MAGEELNVKKMKVQELRDALKERGLPTEGLKGDLISRLEAYFDEQEFALPGEGMPPTPTGSTKATVEEPPVPAPPLEPSPPVEETTPKEASVETAAVETAEETAKPGTEPAPAPVVPEPTPAVTTQVTAEMTYDEKKAARAARFGIAVVQPKKSPNKKRQQQHDSNKPGSNKKQKKPQANSPQKKTAPQKKEQPLLSVEEIEKRLKRAEKFGTGDPTQTAELKAMLRKHRFASSS